jgi:two-component system sensor histidine kinase VicK
MVANRNWKSIRWRIVLIYFLLVFIALTITGVFIMSQLESYQMESVRNNFTKIVQENVMSLQEYDDLDANREEIQADTMAWSESLREELFVVNDNFIIIASSNLNFIGKSGLDLLEQSVLVKGLSGEIAEIDSVLSSGIPVKNMVFPIEKNDRITGVVCLRADISSVYETQSQSRMIFLRSMLLALLVTVFLGFFIARSITVPINDVTKKAERMSQGDFSQVVSVKSDDEIGQLASMFNLLREKLDYTLSEISNEKSKLEAILKNMVDGLLAVDMEGRVILANPAAMEMLSITQSDIEEKQYDDIINVFNKELVLEQLIQNCGIGGFHGNFDHGGKSYAVRYDKFQEENEQDAGFILLLQDITEQQKLESMQRDFVANVSHELKTPLTTIKSYTETLLDQEITDVTTINGFLAIIDGEADRMNRLVRELLQLSRLDYKQEKLFKKESNLVSIVKSAVTKVEMTATNKGQHLNCIFDSGQKIMSVIDKDSIDQVLLNILSNAIKYTPSGGRIDVDLYKEGALAHIIISDNGIGISDKEIPRVFERFYRVDKARSREMGGTGLGLSIAKQIVEEHGGSIGIESRPGKGTRVTVALPLAPMRGIQNIE